MEEKNHPSPADVADAFVKQYYVILNQCPENLHKFYQEPSLHGWAGVDGAVTPVTTLSGIKEKVMSSDYKYCSVEVKITDAQESMEGGIIVAVTGCLTGKDNVKRDFNQTFFLAKQEKGFFVLNDILRLVNVRESITPQDSAPSAAPRDTCDGPAALNFKAAIQNGKVEEASDLSVQEKNLADGGAAAASSGEKSVSPAKGTKQEPVDAADANEKVSSVVKPATNAKIPSVVTNAATKITYASVLAKETPAVSPKVAAATPNAGKQAVASPTTKPSSPRADISPKVISSSTPSGGVSSSSRVVPKSPRGGQGSIHSTSAYAQAKGIYIGGLPYDITKQGIVDVVKQFGQVPRYSDTIQIRRHEDGFCCGFVEFESADSARRAVEAHHVMFGDKEAYIMYKKPPYNRGGNNGRARSPTRRGPRNVNGNGNSTAIQKDDWISYSQRPRQASRERLK